MTPSIDELDDQFWPMVGGTKFAPGVRISTRDWEGLSDLDRYIVAEELAAAGRVVHDGRLTCGELWHEAIPESRDGMALVIPSIRHANLVSLTVNDIDDVAEAMRIAREWAADFLAATAGDVPAEASRLTTGE